MPLLFAVTLFVSATLLFLVQPMIAKMILPSLGGTPAVWNTCMVFFQAVLLAGYAYAHACTSWLSSRRQVLLHGLVLFLPLLVFPIGVAGGWVPPGDANPIPWLLALLWVSVGLPFFVLATSAPLLQTWFARTGHPSAADPYFLYAASNLGSMLALLGYPIILEPNLALRASQPLSQSWLWTAGYGLFVLLMLACARAVWRSQGGGEEESVLPADSRAESESPGVLPRLRWVALAFVPSSLMLGVTTYITTDIAPIPLLWIIPLALYLLSFILVFAKWPPTLHRIVVGILPLVILVSAFRMLYTVTKWPVLASIGLHLLTLFVVALFCHGELARTRPSPRYLTQFFLLMSLGGVLGGLFNALLAPLIFNSVAEYNAALVLACLLLPAPASQCRVALARLVPDRFAKPVGILVDVALAGMVGAVACTLFGSVVTTHTGITSPVAAGNTITPAIQWIKEHLQMDLVGLDKALAFGLMAVLCYSCSKRPVRFGLALGAFMVAAAYYDVPPPDELQVLCQRRSFFGVHKVHYFPQEESYRLMHGTTLHGQQIRKPGEQSVPLTYYHNSGPIGQVFAEFSGPCAKRNIAVIGLGAGSLSTYCGPGQHVTYYEIDPAVKEIATNPSYFTYLQDCRARWEIVLGDARIRLQEAGEKSCDILVVDAFSSDAIPIHLLTREALELYFRKLSDQGLLAIHISSRHLDLEPVLGNLAQALGASGICQSDDDAETRRIPGIMASKWVVLARQRKDLGGLAEDARWKPIRTDASVGVWTDDYSNLLGVFLWKY